jgi:transcriptional regulator with XRE-family HTH domain
VNDKYLQLVEIGARLRQARIDRDVSQPELARLIGRSKQLVSAWENGHAEMTALSAIACSSVLQITTDWLLTGASRPR